MTIRLLFSFLVLAALAGCEMPQDSAPSPPEDVADATAPEADTGPTYDVRLETTEGDVVIRVHESWAPRGAARFRELVEQKYYDGVKIFRVVPDFVAQFGMAADPEVNKKWEDARIPDDPVRKSNKRGMVTFATSGTDSRTAQVFINFGDNSSLDSQGFSPFGEVIEGMEIVDKFHSGYGEAPQQPSIAEEGNVYLEREFPDLDAIKAATIVAESSGAAASGDRGSQAADTAGTTTDDAAPSNDGAEAPANP